MLTRAGTRPATKGMGLSASPPQPHLTTERDEMSITKFTMEVALSQRITLDQPVMATMDLDVVDALGNVLEYQLESFKNSITIIVNTDQ